MQRTENVHMTQKQAHTSVESAQTVNEDPLAGTLQLGSIRERNQAKILKAAEAVFADKGFDGATTGEIAERAGLPKPNIHYYFGTKQQLYDRVIEDILDVWLDAMDAIQPESDPADAITNYIRRKIRASQQWPDSSRLWAMEIISGGRNVSGFLQGRLRNAVREKGKVIAQWAAEGRMDPVDPAHLMFMIWSVTQTYADFGVQIAAVLGKAKLDDEVFAVAEATISSIILQGCGIAKESVLPRSER